MLCVVNHFQEWILIHQPYKCICLNIRPILYLVVANLLLSLFKSDFEGSKIVDICMRAIFLVVNCYIWFLWVSWLSLSSDQHCIYGDNTLKPNCWLNDLTKSCPHQLHLINKLFIFSWYSSFMSHISLLLQFLNS